MYVDDFFDKLMITFFSLLAIGLLVAILMAMTDSIQNYRSYDARNACNAKRMDYNRQTFSKVVTCIPYTVRVDTLTIKR